MRKILFLSFLLLSTNLCAEVLLNLTLIHKKGVNKGLILVSELHSLEKIRADQQIQLIMKNGYTVKLFASFLGEKIIIKGKFYENKKSKGINFSEMDTAINVGEEKDIELKNSGDQLLLLRIMPRTL